MNLNDGHYRNEKLAGKVEKRINLSCEIKKHVELQIQ
jgi:hypothetical protein